MQHAITFLTAVCIICACYMGLTMLADLWVRVFSRAPLGSVRYRVAKVLWMNRGLF